MYVVVPDERQIFERAQIQRGYTGTFALWASTTCWSGPQQRKSVGYSPNTNHNFCGQSSTSRKASSMMSSPGAFRYGSIAAKLSQPPTAITTRGFICWSIKSRCANRRRRSRVLTFRKSSSLITNEEVTSPVRSLSYENPSARPPPYSGIFFTPIQIFQKEIGV